MISMRIRFCDVIKLNTLTRSCSTNRKKFDPNEHFRAKEIPEDIWLENKDPKWTGFEEVKGHWHYVEQLFPKLRIPAPPKSVSSTGWKAPSEKIPDLPYYVARNKNHMLPVYKDHEGVHRTLTTKVRRVLGDIYIFEYDLKTYLEEKEKTKIDSHVNEIGCWVSFKGDRKLLIEKWLYDKGF